MKVAKRFGFTLAELLVVITIIGVLVGLLLPAVMTARSTAQRAQCSNRQAQVGKALIQYELAKQSFPGYAETFGNLNVNWAIRALPNLGREDLWAEWRAASQTGRRTTTMGADLAMLRCSTDIPTETYPLSFVVNCGLPNTSGAQAIDWPANGLFHNRMTRNEGGSDGGLASSAHVFTSTSDIKDGVQYTILVTENLQASDWCYLSGGAPVARTNEYRIGVTWLGQPAYPSVARLRINEDKASTSSDVAHSRPSANHGNVVMVTFCDGSQRPIRENIEYFVYAQLMTPDGQNIMQTRSRMDVSGTPAVPKTSSYTDWYRPLSEKDFQ